MWSLFAFSASILAGINSILQKETLKKLHAVQLMTVTMLVSVLLSLLFIPFVDLSVNLREIGLIAISAVIYATAYIFSVRAMRHMDCSMVAPFFNIGTAFTAIMAVIVFKEVLTVYDLVGISLLILGGYVLELKSRNLLQPIKDIVKSDSIHYLLGGVFLFSIGFILSKYVLETVEPLTFLFYQNIGALVVFLGVTFFMYKGLEDIKEGFANGKLLVPLMALLVLIENIFLFEALKKGEAALVVPLYRTWTLWAVIFGGRILHENHVFKRSLASLLMILGAAVILIW
jgi:drug/metabolite transporter (DMT)-like permease